MSLLGLIVTSCDLAVKSQFFTDADSSTCRARFALDLTTLVLIQPSFDQVSVWLGLECRGSPWALLGKGQAGRAPFPRLLGASCGKGSVLTTSGHWVLWISTKLVRWHQHILLGTSTAGVAWVRRKETCRMRNLGARDGRVIFLSQRTEANKKPAYAGSLSPQNVCMVWENNTNKT